MLRILEEFPQDPILSIYVIDDVWEYMTAIKVCVCKALIISGRIWNKVMPSPFDQHALCLTVLLMYLCGLNIPILRCACLEGNRRVGIEG